MSPTSTSTRRSPSAPTLVSALCLLVFVALVSFNLSAFFPPRRDTAWLDYDHDAESLAEATRVPKIVSSEASAFPTDVHTFQDDGEVAVGTDAPRHPVFDILEQASSEWDALLDAHGGDHARALLQYRLRSSGSNRPISAVSPLHLFNPISPSLLSPRQREAEILPDTFTLILRSGEPSISYGNLTASVSAEHRAQRVALLLDAIQPFAHTLPDLRATFNLLPHPRHALPAQAVDTLGALAADQPLPNSPVKFRSQAGPAGTDAPHGRPLHADDLVLLEGPMTRLERWSWENACRAQVDKEAPEDEDRKSDLPSPIRFVASPKTRSDPCVHRAVTELHPFYQSTDNTYHTRLSPIISETTAPWASDVLLPPLDFFASNRAEDVPAVPWDNKTAGLYWRGSQASQLQRLFNSDQSSEHQLLLPTDNEGFVIDLKQLTDVLAFDVQSGSEDESRPVEMGWKFLADMGDGTRMQEKMASGALVFRPLSLGDWVSEHSVPWVHYVPVQPDLSDLPSLMAFFARHDARARGIAAAGQAWAREQLSAARARAGVREVLEGWAGLGL